MEFSTSRFFVEKSDRFVNVCLTEVRKNSRNIIFLNESFISIFILKTCIVFIRGFAS